MPEKEVEKKMGAHCIFTLHFTAMRASEDCMHLSWSVWKKSVEEWVCEQFMAKKEQILPGWKQAAIKQDDIS